MKLTLNGHEVTTQQQQHPQTLNFAQAQNHHTQFQLNSASDGSLSPQRNQSFIAAVISAIRNATTHSGKRLLVRHNKRHNGGGGAGGSGMGIHPHSHSHPHHQQQHQHLNSHNNNNSQIHNENNGGEWTILKVNIVKRIKINGFQILKIIFSFYFQMIPILLRCWIPKLNPVL